jgi:hypothetical protein
VCGFLETLFLMLRRKTEQSSVAAYRRLQHQVFEARVKIRGSKIARGDHTDSCISCRHQMHVYELHDIDEDCVVHLHG